MRVHLYEGGLTPLVAHSGVGQAICHQRAMLAEAGVDRPDAVATTIGPGLSGALRVLRSACYQRPEQFAHRAADSGGPARFSA